MPTKVMLAKKYENQDPTGWMMSEKIDGVRAIWDGKGLWSRNHKPLHAPKEFLCQLPKCEHTLDGELTIGRDKFQKTVSVVRKKNPILAEWEHITYKVFDYIGDETAIHRYATLRTKIPIEGVVQLLSQVPCENIQSLIGYYNRIIDKKGEGVMLRNPESFYEFRRSPNLLKMKPLVSSEAEVISIETGEGKYTHCMGYLVCVWNSKVIKIGSGFTDLQRDNPPDIGSIVTFNYQALTDSGMPRFPIFISVRDYE